MELNLRLCVMLVVLFGDVLAVDDVIQAANTNILSPDRRAAVKERCQNIRRDCIATGDIFRRSVVCGGGKRFINECALQLRSCDLLLDTGEEILQERCFWVVAEEKPITPHPEIITPSRMVTVVDHFLATSEAHEPTQVTTRRPSTVHGDFFPWFSTSERPTTQKTTTNPSTEGATTSRYGQTTNFVIDHGGVRFSSTPFPHLPWTPEFTTGESSGFRPPNEVNIRDCCRGDTPCKSCLRQDKGGEVCGSDGKTYDTECALDNYACDTGNEDLRVNSKGSCPSNGGRHRTPKPPPPAPPRGDLGKR